MGLLGEEGLVTEGDIWYKGENLTDMSEKKLRKYLGKEIGMVFQDCKGSPVSGAAHRSADTRSGVRT